MAGGGVEQALGIHIIPPVVGAGRKRRTSVPGAAFRLSRGASPMFRSATNYRTPVERPARRERGAACHPARSAASFTPYSRQRQFCRRHAHGALTTLGFQSLEEKPRSQGAET